MLVADFDFAGTEEVSVEVARLFELGVGTVRPLHFGAIKAGAAEDWGLDAGDAALDEGRTEGDVFLPGDVSVDGEEVFDVFGEVDFGAVEFDFTAEAEMRVFEVAGVDTFGGGFVRENGAFTMNAEPGGVLFRGGHTEEVQTEVVAGNAREQFRLMIGAVFGVLGLGIGGGLDRGPRRGPKGVDFGGFVEEFGDVTAFGQDGEAELRIFQGPCAAVAICAGGHCR